MSYEAEYLIVAGTLWVRRQVGRAWAVTFGPARVRTGADASWSLSERRARAPPVLVDA